MTATLDHGDHIFECDTCNASLSTETSNWDSAQNLMRRQGWKPVKRKDNWEHACPKCQKSSK